MTEKMNFGKINVTRFLNGKMLTRLYHLMQLPSKVWREITFDVYILSYKTKKVMCIVPTSLDSPPAIFDMLKKICNEDMVMTKTKRIYAWELRRFIDRQNVVIAEMYRPLIRFFGDGLIVPSLVNQVLDIDKPLDDAIKIKRNKINKLCEYSYEVSQDHDTLKFFYEKMYISYIKSKYGDSAVEKFNIFEKIFKNGELVLVKLNGGYVSGGLNEMIGNTYYLRKNGILDDSFVKEGALLAAYYFSVQRAKQRNAKMVDFGRSKPFLSDGVLKHKNLWGTTIHDDCKEDRYIYLKNILFEQPFIYVDNGKLKAVVFSENDKLIKEYAKSGLEFKVITQDTWLGDNKK